MLKYIALTIATLSFAACTAEGMDDSDPGERDEVAFTSAEALSSVPRPPVYCSTIGAKARFADGCCSTNGTRFGNYQCTSVVGKRMWIYVGGSSCSPIACDQSR